MIATNFTSIATVCLSLAAMLGLAVGIDYSLFIISRFRQEYAKGYSIQQSIAIANGTAGTAVVFAGLTVIIALIGLAIPQIPFLSKMGYCAAITVFLAIVVAVTVVPALLKVFGPKFTPPEMGPIPSDEDYEHSLTAKDAVVRQLIQDGKRIGGVVLQINEESGRNEVDFFYTLSSAHGKGVGTKAWFAIEAAFPETKVWELHTPYFEKRNIHFYVNKCGFKIVEFYHKGHPGPNVEGEEPESDEEYEFFRFEKVMTKEIRNL